MSRYKKCPSCGGKMRSYARLCRLCYRKSVKKEEPPPEPRVAWRYDCLVHGIKVFSFDPHRSVRLTCGHEVKRGQRFVYGES